MTPSNVMQREDCPLCGQSDDTHCAHPGPGADTWTCPACGHDWSVEVTEPVDRRMYRTELEQPSAMRGRWGLYLDGQLIARTDAALDHWAAQSWAHNQMGERVAWSNGRTDPAECWHWVANPAQTR